MLTEAQREVLWKKLEGFKTDCDSRFKEGSSSPATVDDVSQLSIYVHGLLYEILDCIEKL